MKRYYFNIKQNFDGNVDDQNVWMEARTKEEAIRNKLKGVSNDTPIYVVLDKGDDNYDEDGNLRVVHPIESVQREWMVDCSGMDDEPERNLILHLADDFYETYECKLKQ